MPKKNGFALIQVLILMVVLTVLGTTFIMLNSSEVKRSEIYYDEVQAGYYAMSGQEMGIRMFENGFMGFNCHFYGNSENITGPVTGSYTLGSSTIIDANPVIINISSTGSNPYTITIDSIGNSEGVRKTMRYVFEYPVLDQSLPPPVPSILEGKARDGGASDLKWYAANGLLNASVTNNISDKPVVLSCGSGIYKDSKRTLVLKAPQMYFTDTTPYSLSIKKDKNVLNLYADIFVFSGTVTKTGGGLDTINVYNSSLLGSDIDPAAIAGTRYGVVYFGGIVNGITLPAGLGYYYFPDNTQIYNWAAMNRLIKINDINMVNFTKLGTQFDFGMEPGTFRAVP